MSQLTNKDIKKIARLARIEVNETQCETLTKQVSSVISWIEQLSEVDTNNVEPMNNPNQNSLVMAKDIVSDGNITEDVLRNAKNVKYNYFSTPKVIE